VGASGSQPGHQNQLTDVIPRGDPGLCGVFRITTTSGGYVWDLFANCSGLEEPAFSIYTVCEEALADFDPLPELVVTDFSYSGVCPDILLEVEITNVGGATAPASPLKIDFAHPLQEDIEEELGPIPPSSSVVSSIPVTLIETPMEATALVDEGDQVFECSEDLSGGRPSAPRGSWTA